MILKELSKWRPPLHPRCASLADEATKSPSHNGTRIVTRPLLNPELLWARPRRPEAHPRQLGRGSYSATLKLGGKARLRLQKEEAPPKRGFCFEKDNLS